MSCWRLLSYAKPAEHAWRARIILAVPIDIEASPLPLTKRNKNPYPVLVTDDSAPSPTPLAWARAARVIARGTPLFDVAAALGVSIEEVERKIAEDRHYAELIAFRKERRQAPLEKRLDTIREGLVDELEHALDTGSARGLGWMLREIRLGLQLTGLTGKVAEAARGGAAVFDWDKTQPYDEPGGPDRHGTHMERFLASLCDADYDDWLATGKSPYPARKPPLPNNAVRWARARAAMRGEAVPAATPEELASRDYAPIRILDELEEAIARGEEAGMASSERMRLQEARPRARERDPGDVIGGGSNAKAPEPTPPRARTEEEAAKPAAPPSYKDRMAQLRERLRALLADPVVRTQEDLELAEAVCSLRWPNWPPLRGPPRHLRGPRRLGEAAARPHRHASPPRRQPRPRPRHGPLPPADSGPGPVSRPHGPAPGRTGGLCLLPRAVATSRHRGGRPAGP